MKKQNLIGIVLGLILLLSQQNIFSQHYLELETSDLATKSKLDSLINSGNLVINNLYVSGRTSIRTGIDSVYTDTTLTDSQCFVLVNSTIGDITITLDSTMSDGQEYYIKKISNDINNVIVQVASGTQTKIFDSSLITNKSFSYQGTVYVFKKKNQIWYVF